jgi:hypothetical protein
MDKIILGCKGQDNIAHFLKEDFHKDKEGNITINN